MFIIVIVVVIVISLEHYAGIRRYNFVQVQVQYSVHSIFRKFNLTESVHCAQLHHIANIAEVRVANYLCFR